MARNDTEMIDLDDMIVVRRLHSSLLVLYEGEEFPVPFSQIEDNGDLNKDSDPDDEGTLTVPLWLAKDRGVV